MCVVLGSEARNIEIFKKKKGTKSAPRGVIDPTWAHVTRQGTSPGDCLPAAGARKTRESAILRPKLTSRADFTTQSFEANYAKMR